MRVCLLLCGLVLAGCDPAVHLAYEKDFKGAVDFNCVEQALRSVVPDVQRGTYVSSRMRPGGFPPGVTVTQFDYTDPRYIGHYSLNIAHLPDGRTHYFHEWSKLGFDVPQEEEAKVLPLLNRANDAVAKKCGLPFAGAHVVEGRG